MPDDEIGRRLIARQLHLETNSLKFLDELRHWGNHQEYINWFARENERKHAKVRLGQEMAKFKCIFCGGDASKIPLKRRRAGLKYCSTECHKQARVAFENLRLKSDPEFWKRKRAYVKISRDRKRRESPEEYRAEIRRREANPKFRMAKNVRNRLGDFVRKGLMNKTKGTSKLVGCSWAFLANHFESKFKRGMTWKNYGKVWHIDHKIPLSKFNLMNSVECDLACNWQNLQPMFGPENLSKSNKIIDGQVSLPLVMT